MSAAPTTSPFTMLNMSHALAPRPTCTRTCCSPVDLALLVSVLVLPMPTWVVDIGLSTSITLSVLILMVAIWIEKPLDFSAFPTVLLVATLLRLALNLATSAWFSPTATRVSALPER